MLQHLQVGSQTASKDRSEDTNLWGLSLAGSSIAAAGEALRVSVLLGLPDSTYAELPAAAASSSSAAAAAAAAASSSAAAAGRVVVGLRSNVGQITEGSTGQEKHVQGIVPHKSTIAVVHSQGT